MIYPTFLKKNNKIGMTALSSGCEDCLDELEQSLEYLRKDYQVILTSDVYGQDLVSASISERVKEFNHLLEEDVSLIYIARGGDFLLETLPYLDYQKLLQKPKWIQGYSDPTSLLYFLTTKYDLATIYGLNGKSFYSKVLENYQKNNLNIIKGNLVTQTSFPNSPNKSLYHDFTSEGILIGGCLDVLKNIIGTPFDNTFNFLEKYQNQKIIWYFDIYNMSSVEVYLTLFQLKQASWFRHSDTFLFGMVCYPAELEHFTYRDALQKVFDETNHVVYDANIGHVKPCFTLINGSLAQLSFQKQTLTIKQTLLEDK